MWEVIWLRANGEYVGQVKARDEKAAKKAAIKQLGLRKAEADRLLRRA